MSERPAGAREHERPLVCVLGGSGFVGRHLCARLVRDGWSVRVPTRSRARHRDLLVLPALTLVESDIHDPTALQSVCADSAAVINLVGILNDSRGRGRSFEDAHVALARVLAQACARTGVARVLQMSALKADMSDAPSRYLRSKGEAEAILSQAPGLAVTILRPSLIFGPDDSFLNRFAALLRLPSPVFPLPRAQTRFAPVYIGDVVEAFSRCLADARTVGQRYELCGPDSYSLREIVQMIADAVSLRRHILSMPDALARVQAQLLGYLPGTPMSLDNFLSLTVDSLCGGNGLAQLGIQPTALSYALEQLGGGARQLRYSRYRARARS